ncbi:glycoside hydrolase family 27 protein [Chitinophagaceae bacterium 26-R-25]|nr:glycoside hydrolase family 27 protein [Chitinophagaceae bacterium 26-R-25]
MKRILVAIASLIATTASAQKFEGLANTPPMGWNSWNIFWTDINEEKIKAIADLMVSTGLKDAGYNYLVLDDGWMLKDRDSVTGDLVADPKKFPNGMKAVGDYIHAKGLKFGIYNCAGTLTCQGLAGTRGNEYQDARYYASIGADYLKFDWCHSEGINAKEAYTTMSKAIQKAGRPMIFSLCEWGNNKAWEWGKPVGQLWRTTEDIYQVFDGYHDYGTWKANGVMTNADLNEKLRSYSGPGGWNDPDMLEVGNGMTMNEDKAHFSIWCIMAAPLMMGNDLRKISNETLSVFLNKDAIAVDQDPLAIQGFRYMQKDSMEVWVKPLANDEWAVCFLNRKTTPQNFQFNWKAQTIQDTLFHKTLDMGSTVYNLYDIWQKKITGTTAKPFSATVQAHDAYFFRLSKKTK